MQLNSRGCIYVYERIENRSLEFTASTKREIRKTSGSCNNDKEMSNKRCTCRVVVLQPVGVVVSA